MTLDEAAARYTITQSGRKPARSTTVRWNGSA